ncbi:ATP cone domain-containing protein [Flagellimonas lutaonensis]|uniref:ATPase n=1 Tax=Flagellimonas lutaonensis TaxID=516051 RepID=A0A0D5YPV7_9FLAO|nr:ATP cone domain-containing protein [Allomuricauda lutaonensis]AKA34267.1 ATPase [Allomuricauda lutaonensis]
MNEQFEVIKSTGEKAPFSLNKLKASLKKSGANDQVVEHIVQIIKNELYPEITTEEIHNRAFALLKRERSVFASKYKLKKAIYELGPTGFPFERFVGQLLKYSGYTVEVGQTVQGFCVKHEIDVLAENSDRFILVECKFHGDKTKKCNVKDPLYLHSRYNDVQKRWNGTHGKKPLKEVWLVTNTRFTADALQYGKCAGLFLLGWNHPKNDALKDRIDRLGLYPITVSTLLTKREKEFLLSRDVVLCRQLLGDRFFLDHLGISDTRKKRILDEMNMLCTHNDLENAND